MSLSQPGCSVPPHLGDAKADTQNPKAPTAFAAIGWKYYVVFIVITSVFAVIVWFYFPEVS